MGKRRFTATDKTTRRDLRNTMGKVGATSLRIEMDEFSGEVTVVFDRPGRRYRKSCARWGEPQDNLRAIGLSIDYMWRAVEVYGVEHDEEALDRMIDAHFLPLEAPPDDSALMLPEGTTEWWEVLGISRNAYRALALTHHPDHGGTDAEFGRLQKAYKRAMEE